MERDAVKATPNTEKGLSGGAELIWDVPLVHKDRLM